jgi:class 3 adenylate cyclase
MRRCWSRFRPQHDGHDTVCGKCAYLVSNLPTFTCPECGSDLREVGIVRRTRPPRAGLRWSDLPKPIRRKYTRRNATAALIAVVLSQVMSWAIAWIWDQPAWWFTSRSTSYTSLGIEAPFLSLRLLGMNFAREPADLRVTLHLKGVNGTDHAAYVDLPSLHLMYWHRDSSSAAVTRKESSFDQESLLRWMSKTTGADTKDPQVVAEAKALVAAFKQYDSQAPVHRNVLFNSVVDHLVNASGPMSGPFKPGWTMTGNIRVPWSSYLFGLILAFTPYIIYSRLQTQKAFAEGKAKLIAEGLWEEPAADEGIAESRTLTVLFSDMKDFTMRAASSSRADLLRLLRTNRRIVEKGVVRYGGSIVKTAGDGVLARFDSATNAVLAGLEVQRLAKLHNQTAAANDVLDLRIAISTCEVTVEREDVYGPAVNLAARLQTVTPIGDVYLTDATRQSVTDSEVRTETLERMEFKGTRGSTVIHRAVPA